MVGFYKTSFVHSIFFPLMEFPPVGITVFFFFLMTKKSSESWVVMGFCDREKHPIIGRRGSCNTSKKSEMAFICLRQEFDRIYSEQTSAIHLTTFSIFAIYALPFP